MYARTASGENAAAVAPVISSDVVVGLALPLAPRFSRIKTWFGIDFVSETMSLLLSGEIARIFPGTLFICVTVLDVPGVNVINPSSLPRNAFDPLGAKMNEFGELGRVVLLATVLLL